MAKLTAAERNHLPASDFAIPASREYPIEDKSHASNAKARAKQELNRGLISQAKYDEVVAAANKVLNG